MEMQFMESGDKFTHVALIGNLDMVGVEEVRDTFQAELATRGQPAIVDISQLDFIASMGMGMLMNAAKALKRQGHPMVLLNAQPLVAEALELVKIQLVIPMAESLEDALDICQNG